MNVDPATLSLGLVVLVQTGGLCFFMGGLASRVSANSKRIEKLEVDEGIDGNSRNSIAVKIAALETRLSIELEHLGKGNDQISREMRGLSRQVASLATSGRPGVIPPLMDAQGD